MAMIWVEVAFTASLDESASFVGRIDQNLQEVVFAQADNAFIRFEFVRWLDEDGKPEPNEKDDEFGTDHYFYLRRSVIHRIAPIRGEFVAFWDKTLPDYATPE